MSIPAGPPKDYTALAIIGTILSACTSCIGLITGIIAIVQNNKAQKLYAAGDIAGSYSAANTAKILLIVTWVLVAIGLLFSGGLWISGNYPAPRGGGRDPVRRPGLHRERRCRRGVLLDQLPHDNHPHADAHTLRVGHARSAKARARTCLSILARATCESGSNPSKPCTVPATRSTLTSTPASSRRCA